MKAGAVPSASAGFLFWDVFHPQEVGFTTEGTEDTKEYKGEEGEKHPPQKTDATEANPRDKPHP